MSRDKLTPEQQKAQMLHLMNFRGEVNENKNTKLGTVEYAKLGPNDKTYAIIKENNRFYIEVAPKKDNVVLEDYEYLGGSKIYKNLYEYTSYNHALKIFEEYMMNLNSSHGKVLNEEKKQNEYQELMTESSLSMKKEIERQRQIMINASKIMNESSGMTSYKLNEENAPMTKHPGDPESNGKAGPFQKQGDPFVITDKPGDMNDLSNNGNPGPVATAGDPFDKGTKGEKAEDSTVVKDLGTAGQGKSIAMAEPPTEAKAVKVNEGALNELSIDDDSILTDEISPDEDEISLDDDLFSDDDTSMSSNAAIDTQDVDLDKQDIELDSQDIELDQELIDKISDLESKIENLTALLNDEEVATDEIVPDTGEETTDLDIDEVTPPFQESKQKINQPTLKETIKKAVNSGKGAYLVNEDGTVLHDFGNHPGYRKVPFSTPANQDPTEKQSSDTKDWFGPSAANDQPFGQKIGSGDPFEEKVQLITDAIMAECIKKGIFKKVNEKMEVTPDWEPKKKGNHEKSLAMNRLDANGTIHGDFADSQKGTKMSENKKKV